MLIGQLTRQTPHVSFFRRRLERVAQGRPLADWLVEELNRRGHLGAYTASEVTGAPAEQVSLEELIVALAMPHAEADARNWKLIIRALQKGPFDPATLARLAKLERADALLAWLLRGLPATERSPVLERLAALLHPRDPRDLDVRYDFTRLLRRPATREAQWRHRQG
jgi:hypothetical protein